MKVIWRRMGQTLFLVLFFSLAILHFARPVNFATADLGRHLKNGELFWQSLTIPATNFYSYTYPDFSAVCHHWLSGVVFKAVFDRFGAAVLSVSYVVLLGVTLLICIFAAARQSRFSWAILAALFALPLVGYRTEIRPEGFSTLFLALYFLILNEYRRGFLAWPILLILLPLQVAWVNAHVFFIFGILLVGVFILSARINEKDSRKFQMLSGLAVLLVLVSFINPFGAAGVFQPFNIFKEYGYELAENQSAFFMMRRFPQEMIYPYFLGVMSCLGLVIVFCLVAVKDRLRMFVPLIVALAFGLMAMRAVRATAMFGFLFIPVFAWLMDNLCATCPPLWRTRLRRSAAVLAGILLVLGLVVPRSIFSPLRHVSSFLRTEDARYGDSFFSVLARPYTWLNGLPGIEASAGFWRDSGLRGPVFNNYDIGGYLIYYLFPQERVFVDNRPEAYPVAFFKKTYVPMQEDEAVWKRESSRYGFQAIYFYRLDMTPWAQPFLIRRLSDPQWAPVFVDNYTIILLRRGGVNQSVINKHELPKSIFRVSPN